MAQHNQVENVVSGDIVLRCRTFGQTGGVPVVIMHGANHCAADWHGVARHLSHDREVAVYDARGFGESTWSPDKDYTHDANVADLLAILDHLGWSRASVVGHTRGAAFATLAATFHPDRIAGLSLIDWIPNTGVRHPGTPLRKTQSIGNASPRFATFEDALRATTRSPQSLHSDAGRKLLETFVQRDGGSLIFGRRDPDFLNPVPTRNGGWPTAVPLDIDLWDSLAEVGCPIQYVEPLRSDIGIPHADRERLRREYQALKWTTIDGGSDLAFEAPEALANTIGRFLADTIDPAVR